jgi:Flavoprotein
MVLDKPAWLVFPGAGHGTFGAAWFVSNILLNAVTLSVVPTTVAGYLGAGSANAIRRNSMLLPWYQLLLWSGRRAVGDRADERVHAGDRNTLGEADSRRTQYSLDERSAFPRQDGHVDGRSYRIGLQHVCAEGSGAAVGIVTDETPLNLIHIRNMETVRLAGATALPPMPAFYHRPETINDLFAQTSGKILDQFGITHHLFQRWGERSLVSAPQTRN